MFACVGLGPQLHLTSLNLRPPEGHSVSTLRTRMDWISDAARKSDASSGYYTHVDNMFLPAALSFGTLIWERGLSPTATCINPVNAVIANPPAGILIRILLHDTHL